MKHKFYLSIVIAVLSSMIIAGCGLLPGQQPPAPTASAANLRATADAMEAPTTSVPAPAPTAETTTSQVLACGEGREMTVPDGGQIFWSNHRSGNTDLYAVVYDPGQGGSSDHKPYGWWYQPCLPSGPDREDHEVAIVLQAGAHRFTGPECRAWLNEDGNSPWEQGELIISRQNVLSMTIAATAGHGTEAWVAVKCVASWASGFSFERLEPMP